MSKERATNASLKNYKRNEPEGKCNGFNIDNKILYNKCVKY